MSTSERKHRSRRVHWLVLCRRAQSSRAHVRNLYGLSSVLECSVPLRLQGITIRNAHPDQQGTASVNPIFTSVRLAHRVTIRRTATLQATSRATTESDDQVKPSWRNGA